MVDVGELIQINSRADRRITTYILSPDYRRSLAKYSHLIAAMAAADGEDQSTLQLSANSQQIR